MITQAVILCGGKGERLGDALRYNPTVLIPKPLIEVGGKPFVTYAIAMLKGIGITDIILTTRNQAGHFVYLQDDVVRVVGKDCEADAELLLISHLHDLFLLLNGDSFPIMDWRAFINTDKPRVAVKVVGRDAGVAIVRKADIGSGHFRCLDMKSMMSVYENYTILGGLHIGTPQGLQRARAFMDIVVYGQ